MHLYFMGICGTAMGNVALMMRELGHQVSGADTGIYPPMSDLLRAAKVDILDGYDPKRLEAIQPDRVVVGNAMSRGNPEVEWLLETRRFPMVSLPELLNELVLSRRRNIVVAGTHGKTTTTSLAAFLLRESGYDPGYLVGGVPRDLPDGAHAGNTDHPFVIEGDEYDSAFFDKRSKFIHYQPHILVLNNLEFDHADIFRDLADIKRTFSHVIRLVPRSGFILYNGDNPNLNSLLPVPFTQCIRVGMGEDNDLQIRGFQEHGDQSSFQLLWRGTIVGKVNWRQVGRFNARNAAMAFLAAGLSVRPDDPFCAIDLQHLQKFVGVKRRQEVLLETGRLKVIEDFGHHPTAIAETLESLRARHPGWEIAACFEPRSNTARMSVFQREFKDALAGADWCLIGPVDRAEKLAPEQRLNTGLLAGMLEAAGKPARAFDDNQVLLSNLKEAVAEAQKDTPVLVVFFSNGSFGGIIPAFAEHFAKTSSAS